MAISKFIRDDFRFLIFSEIYHNLESSKQKRAAMQISEAAISIFAKRGFYDCSKGVIAKEAGVSIGTVDKYFPSLQGLQLFSIKYTRLLFQKYVLSEIKDIESAKESFEVYFDSCFKWPKYFPSHTSFWLSFAHHCSFNKEFRALNTIAVNVGLKRLATILEKGKLSKEFGVTDVKSTTLLIHTLITGQIFSEATESNTRREDIFKACLELLF